MTQPKIHLLVGIRGAILVVFHTNAKCWQFQIISFQGVVFSEQKVYYTAETAELVGRGWIRQGR
ncbi:MULTISPECIES: hypothetical protein [Cyanophyceae]|uniref:hypothetical protein n=1 Tax=Chroococcidiopsis sp. TS-821 TaxID=1378066 RepID=UPI0002A67044|nr:hypothetical protein [Chroococcidiopsis sp. TS-821]AFZ33511.1 hypothetical protein Glo7428_5128 [Gloeocapsa sp. PCC 7428]PIG91588.1 hypothetical protein CSQ79_20315 [Gloeocapsopsis sp. IPPAS B-1203]PPS42018.1 hypothetical protein B1A85_16270 [Chroococcidiopsis sp. TS-821]